MVTPFNLREGPPLRVKIIKTGAGQHVLYMDLHHIITDGLSQKYYHERVCRAVRG
ncbi:condensation domain-containing protein [Paenibacillus rhizoplanae]